MRKCTTLLLLLIPFLAFAQRSNKKEDIERYKLMLDTVQDLETKFDMLNDICVYYGRNNIDSALKYNRMHIKVLEENGRYASSGLPLHRIGVIERRKNNLDQAILYYDSALERYQNKPELIKNTIGIYVSKGHVHKAKNELENALKSYLKAAEICNELGFVNGEAIALKSTGDILVTQDKKIEANTYFQKAYDLLKGSSASIQKSGFLSSIGASFIMLDKLDSAMMIIKQAEILKNELNDIQGLSYVYTNIATIYDRWGNYDSAIFYQSKGLNAAKQVKLKTQEILSNSNLAEMYLNKRNYAKTQYHLNQAKQLVGESQDPSRLRSIYKIQYRSDSLQGNFQAALYSYQQMRAFEDSIFNRERSKDLATIETKYQTQIKDQEISSLKQEAVITNLESERRLLISLGLLALLIFLAISGTILYRQIQARRKTEKAYLEQKILRMQINPHFIFNTLNAVQHLILSNNENTALSYVSRFGKLMRKILEHSREEAIPVSEEVEMLENYLQVQQVRLNNSFTYQIEIDDELEPDLDFIPPLFAQPFVENAIEHGVSQVESGHIDISFSLKGKQVELEIRDNGPGIKHAGKSEHRSLATIITKERVEILRRDKNQLIEFEVKSPVDTAGTLVRFVLPLTQGNPISQKAILA
jgi:tetratricopeptide (TPR) repeat protein